MSDSDDAPLATRLPDNSGKPKAEFNEADKIAPIAKRAAVKKAPVIHDHSDSDDEDIPLSNRKVAPPPKPKAKAKSKPVAQKSAPTKKKVTPAKKAAPAKGRAAKTPVKQKQVEEGKAPKKKYELVGQTRDTPPENDPLRVFYSSLYEQTEGASDMATKWMVMYGLLEESVAKAAVERLKDLKAAAAAVVSNSPLKSAGQSKAGSKPKAKPVQKRTAPTSATSASRKKQAVAA